MTGVWNYNRQVATPGKVCKHAGDDPAHSRRPAPYPGPFCTSCHRASRKARKQAAHASHVARTYGLEPGDYDALYAAQCGRCAGCGKATGRTRRLAADHDHSCRQGHPSERGCRACVRGLLCSTCNRTIGRYQDNPVVFDRLAAYLRDPPARAVLDDH